MVTENKKIARTTNYKNKKGIEIQVRYSRSWLQNGKKILIYLKDEKKTRFFVFKEKEQLVFHREQDSVECEKNVTIREVLRFSERVGYKELWSIFDDCYYYDFLEE